MWWCSSAGTGPAAYYPSSCNGSTQPCTSNITRIHLHLSIRPSKSDCAADPSPSQGTKIAPPLHQSASTNQLMQVRHSTGVTGQTSGNPGFIALALVLMTSRWHNDVASARWAVLDYAVNSSIQYWMHLSLLVIFGKKNSFFVIELGENEKNSQDCSIQYEFWILVQYGWTWIAFY